MKKTLVSLLILLVFSFSLSAGFIFEFGPHEPLVVNSSSDPIGFTSGLHYLHLLSSSPEGNNILVEWASKDAADPDKFEVVDFRPWDKRFNNYLHLQTGAEAAVLRFGFEDIFILDATISAGLNTVFAATGGADNLGMDGTFFVGAEAEVMGLVDLRFGLRHYSGHVGDEVLTKAFNYNGTHGFEAVQYTRDNYYELGIGFSDDRYIRANASLLFPKAGSWWDPIYHIPDSITPLPGETYADRLPDKWAVRGDYGDSYKAYIFMTDIKASLPIGDKLAIFGGLNLKLHQDGMTKHTLTPEDDDNKWEAEYTLSFGIDFINAIENKNLSLEFIYHDGRFPLLNYYWKRAKYISIGLSIK